MTAREAAKKIGVSRERLYQYLRAGKIQGPPKLGKCRRAWTISTCKPRARPGKPTSGPDQAGASRRNVSTAV